MAVNIRPIVRCTSNLEGLRVALNTSLRPLHIGRIAGQYRNERASQSITQPHSIVQAGGGDALSARGECTCLHRIYCDLVGMGLDHRRWYSKTVNVQKAIHSSSGEMASLQIPQMKPLKHTPSSPVVKFQYRIISSQQADKTHSPWTFAYPPCLTAHNTLSESRQSI